LPGRALRGRHRRHRACARAARRARRGACSCRPRRRRRDRRPGGRTSRKRDRGGGGVRLSLRAAALVAALGAFAYFVAISFARPFVGGDTPFVLDGTNAFLTCLHHHDYDACGYTGKLNYWGLMSPIGWWPLLQHVPDLISIGLGADGHAART